MGACVYKSTTRIVVWVGQLTNLAFVEVGSMAWDVLLHACSHGVLIDGWVSEAFHSCIVIDILLIIHGG